MKTGRNILAIMLLAMLAACSSMECPLNSMVRLNYGVYNASQQRDTLIDTTTISTPRKTGIDSVLVNRLYKDSTFTVPVSYTNERDTFFFDFKSNENVARRDTVVVSKTDRMHFESIECAATYFHTISGVSTTTHAIDSVVIYNKEVDYDSSKEHFRIYLHPRD
ncbi:MAG: alpha amylase [Prevotella sp.]|nr:alpha amylase [Prevotella sp.]